MKFIKVTAHRCNQQGDVIPHQAGVVLFFNIDLIGAIRNSEILPKSGKSVLLGDSYYTRINIEGSIDIPTL